MEPAVSASEDAHPSEKSVQMRGPAEVCGGAGVCLVLGVLTFFFSFLAGIPAIICGHRALSQIRNSPVPMRGKKRAIFALGIGYLSMVVLVGVISAIAIPLMAKVNNGPRTIGETSALVSPAPPKELPREQPKPKPVVKQVLPEINIAAPAVPEQMFDGHDLAMQTSESLEATARAAVEMGEFTKAVQLQHWSVVNAGREGRGGGQYNLACYYALAGHSSSALHWLEQAAVNEGVDPDWARQDRDLDVARNDSRWPDVLEFLDRAANYWASTGIARQRLILPAGYQNDRVLPLMVGLHGLGANEEFVHDGYQAIADELDVAFLGVSGSVPRGPLSFVWAEHARKDHERVQAAIAAVSDRVKTSSRSTAVFGFSQGGWVAGSLAASYPDSYRGGLCLSSGHRSESNFTRLRPRTGSRDGHVVIVYGGKESAHTIQASKNLAAWLRSGSRDVLVQEYPNMDYHGIPGDYWERLPEWVELTMNSQADRDARVSRR